MTNQAVAIFERSLDWLRDHYHELTLRNESDLVTALWVFLGREAAKLDPPLHVDYERTIRCLRSTIKCDLVILSPKGDNLVGVEFKFEPCRKRKDINNPALGIRRGKKIQEFKHLLYGPTKGKDTSDFAKLRVCVEEGKIEVGFAVYIDEGSCYYGAMDEASIPHGARWTHWGVRSPGGFDTAVLMARISK